MNPVYQIASPVLTLLLLLSTACGYLSQDRLLGYWGGNILAVASIANIVAAIAIYDHFALRIPGAGYPLILLLLLNLRYRDAFR